MNSLGLKLQPYITKHHSATGMPFPDWFKALRDLEMNRYTVTLHPHQVLYVAKDGTSFEDTYEAYNSGPVAVNKWDKNAFYEVLKKVRFILHLCRMQCVYYYCRINRRKREQLLIMTF